MEGVTNSIHQALARYRRLSYRHRYGGMAEDYRLAQEALREWERKEQPHQPPLWQGAGEGGE